MGYYSLGACSILRDDAMLTAVVASAQHTVRVLVVGSMTPVASNAARPIPPSSGCVLPASDLCRDHSFRGRRWSGPITYYVNVANAPVGAEQDVHDAFAAWEDELKSAAVEAAYPGDRSSVDFIFGGLTTRGGARDGVNVVYFTPTNGSASVTLTTKGSRISEFDMVFNSTWSWSTDVTCPTHDCGTVDLQNGATHEVGHVLDLYHVTAEADAALTMYPWPAAAAARPSDWRDETSKRDLPRRPATAC